MLCPLINTLFARVSDISHLHDPAVFGKEVVLVGRTLHDVAFFDENYSPRRAESFTELLHSTFEDHAGFVDALIGGLYVFLDEEQYRQAMAYCALLISSAHGRTMEKASTLARRLYWSDLLFTGENYSSLEITQQLPLLRLTAYDLTDSQREAIRRKTNMDFACAMSERTGSYDWDALEGTQQFAAYGIERLTGILVEQLYPGYCCHDSVARELIEDSAGSSDCLAKLMQDGITVLDDETRQLTLNLSSLLCQADHKQKADHQVLENLWQLHAGEIAMSEWIADNPAAMFLLLAGAENRYNVALLPRNMLAANLH